MRIDKAPKEYTIAEQLLGTNTNGKVIFLFNDPALILNNYANLPPDTWINSYLSELYITTRIKSLPGINLPDYEDSDSRSQQIIKTANSNWGSPRFELEFFLRKNATSPWLFKGKVSCTSTNGFPYTSYRPFDFYTDSALRGFGSGTQLAVGFLDCGWGYPSSADSIDLEGSWRQELIAIQPDYMPSVVVQGGTVQAVTQKQGDVNGTLGVSARQLFAPRTGRTAYSIQNSSINNTIYFSYTSTTPTSSNNDGAIPANSIRGLDITKSGSVYAIASGSATGYTTSETYNVPTN